MKRNRCLKGILVAACTLGFAFGGLTVAEGQGRGGRGTGLEVGAPLPDLAVYDAAGKPFQLSQLKGSYTVLVFGCLT